MRKRKTIGQSFTQEVKEHLQLMDFLGRLTPEEIKIAKKHGLYHWDAHQKRQQAILKNQKRGETR